ncbi:MAG TPA: hypothetical protein VHA13_04855 [Gammaproteobacteria bacterium]|nr:hypothetical protein [Gammaproteobacteria bacterium]
MSGARNNQRKPLASIENILGSRIFSGNSFTPKESSSKQAAKMVEENKDNSENNKLLPVDPSTVKIIKQIRTSPKSQAQSNNKAYEPKTEPKYDQENLMEVSQKDNKVWFAKSSPNDIVACCEVVGQELLRLLNPQQTFKTRFFLNGEKLGVISEKKTDFKPLEQSAKKQYIPGLATSVLLALFLNETDLKLQHLDANNGVKIDGDYMLSQIHQKSFQKNSEISTEELQRLPYVAKYNANQWLDQITGGRYQVKKNLMFDWLTADPNFQNELSQAIMRVLVIPPSIYRQFVLSYVTHDTWAEQMISLILARREQLFKAAMDLPSFRHFISDNAAVKKSTEESLELIKNFVTTKKKHLIDDDQYSHLKPEIKMRVSELLNFSRKKTDSEHKSPEPLKSPKTKGY